MRHAARPLSRPALRPHSRGHTAMLCTSNPSAIPASAPTPIATLYRQMWLHAQGARLQLVTALSLMGASQVLKLGVPWLAAQAINAIQTSGRGGLRSAAVWIAAILALHATAWLLHGPARVLERGVALRVRRSLAGWLYGRLGQAPLAWHEQHHSGDLQHRLAQATGALYGFTQTQFIYLQNIIHLLGPLVALWLLSSAAGMAALGGFVVIVLTVLRFDRALMVLALRENHAERRFAAGLLDCVGNISAVASLRLQRATQAMLDTRLLAVFAPLSRSIVLTEWKWCAVDLLTTGLGWLLVVVYALSVLAGHGTADGTGTGTGALLIGSLFMVHQYAQQAGGVLCAMAANAQGLAHTQADHAAADIIARAPVVAAVAPGHTGALAGWQRITLQGIGCSRAATDDGTPRGGVHDVHLELRRGERLALGGPSGCGKSTLLRVLAGLYPPQAGQFVVDGQGQTAAQVGALATLVPQEAEIFEATVRENLTFGDNVPNNALQRAVKASALDEVLAALPQGLDTPMAERGFNLSGGQRQRLALARGVLAARDSSLLLLDEPTSALDAAIEQDVQQRLGRCFAGACMVAAVHRLSLLRHFDRVAWMVAGRVVDVGSVAQVRARQPGFAALLLAGDSETPAVPVHA